MNLEDYAYNEDGRWYVNPQVSLDEQNAFIDNYRNVEAQNNAEITQQTSGLGTQVPSQLGNLVGGGSYFRSRYQTPQTNQTIADLRATAQAAALQTALQNEIAKKQKQYKDAYRAASERGSNKDNTASPLYDTLDSKLKIDVETSVDNTAKDINDQKEIGIGNVGELNSNGLDYWRKGDDEYYLVRPTAASDAGLFWSNPLNAPADQTEKQFGNRRFVYIAAKGQWYEVIGGPSKKSDYAGGD